MGMDTFSGGTTYTVSNLTSEGTSASYGHAAMTNQEILDLLIESINKLMFDLSILVEKDNPIPPGRIHTYGRLSSYFPEYIKSASGTVSGTQGLLGIDDFAFLISGVATITGTTTQTKECIPATREYLIAFLQNDYSEEATTPILTMSPAGIPGQIAIAITFPEDPSATVTFTITYLSRQKELTVASTEDILLSPRYQDRIIDEMIMNYEKLKQMQAQ